MVKISNFSSVFKTSSKYKMLFLSIFMMAIGFGLHKGILDNYLAEVVKMNGMDRGVTEFFRELPGFLLILILAVLYRFSAENIYKIGGFIMVCGMAMLAFVSPLKFLVTLSILVYSSGEHIQLAMKNTLSL